MIIEVRKLKEIAEIEFRDIVEDAIITDINQIRIFMKYGSLIDIWYSLKLEGRYSDHWERRHVDEKIYRHDNIPHKKWQNVPTFPKHFHDGYEEKVIESHINESPDEAVREFLLFAREMLLRNKVEN